jgi:hypothetical protein
VARTFSFAIPNPQDYLKLSGKLASIDLSSLKSDEEKKAFFINLYNVQVKKIPFRNLSVDRSET